MTNIISEAISAVKNWWLFLILGILLVLGGFWVTRTPVESYLALSMVFVALILINGIMQTVFSITNREAIKGWGWYLTGGIFEILVGIFLWSYPAISMVILPFVVGFWLLFRGISVIAFSTDLKDLKIKGWGWILTLGILLTIMSFFMVMDPVFGAFNLIFLTSFALIFMGVAYIMFSFKLKSIKSKTIDVAKNLNLGIGDLKQEVLDNLKEASQETKDKIGKMFDNYDNR